MEEFEMKDGMTLCDLIRMKGFTLVAFSKELGVNRNTVMGWSKGTQEMGVRKLVDACKLLNVPPLFLLKIMGIDISGVPNQFQIVKTVKIS